MQPVYAEWSQEGWTADCLVEGGKRKGKSRKMSNSRVRKESKETLWPGVSLLMHREAGTCMYNNK